MEAVATDDVVAIDADSLAFVPIREIRPRGVDVVRLHVLGIVNHDSAEAVAAVVQVARELGLPVDDHRIAVGQPLQVHALPDAVVGDVEALVDLPLAVHPLGDLRLAHQRREPVLQHARANASEHVVAAVLLQYDRVDAAQVEELRQQEARGAAPDDSHLGLHGGACRERCRPNETAYGCLPGSLTLSILSNSTFHSSPSRFSTRRT